MPVTVPRILIFDDFEADGIEIAKGLWKSGFSARFIHWDENISERPPEKNVGVRIIFMDVDLLGAGRPTTGTFNVVMKALEQFLDKDNGPYVLITWSTWSEMTEDLFQYLMDRMPELGLIPPVSFRVLNKEEFKDNNWARAEEIAEAVKKSLSDLGAVGCLIKWEGVIQRAGSWAIQHLSDLAANMNPKDKDRALRKILWAMATAEGGKSLKEDNAFQHLNTSLSSILYDKACKLKLEDNDHFGRLIIGGDEGEWPSGWRAEIHSLFHLDFTRTDGLPAPGDVFICPSGDKAPIKGLDADKYLRGYFLVATKDDPLPEEQMPEFIECSKLLMTEITPPCDFAQDKYILHTFVLAALIPSKFVRYTWVYDKESGARLKNKLPDYLWSSPEVKIAESEYCIIFNSRLIVSLPKKKIQNAIGERCFRIRQPLTSDMIGWLTRQSSRMGHVALH